VDDVSETVRSVQRVLRLITVMNQRETWALLELAEACGLAKTTVHRLLQTLEAEGYVHSLPGRIGLYRLTTQTEGLSRGLTAATRYADAADPLIIKATKAIGWPVSFGLPETPFLRIVSCGMPFSPERSAKPTSIGTRHWIFTSAVGRAYLSRCSPEQIAKIHDQGEAFRESSKINLPVPTLDELLRDASNVKGSGYSVRQAMRRDLNSAMAAPVYRDDDVIGALALATFPHSLSARVISEFTPSLIQTASEIAAACLGG
jgi:IclR family transcriptional regulator, mhp operon transcriptional activator